MPPITIDVLPDELLQLIFLDFSRFQLYHICLVSQRFSALATGPLYQKISTSSLSSKKIHSPPRFPLPPPTSCTACPVSETPTSKRLPR